MKLFKYALLGLLSAVALATVAKERLITLLRNGEVVATYKSSDIWAMRFRYESSIYPVNEKGEVSSGIISWNKEMNTAIFAIEPKELLDDYTPTYELSENLEPYAHNGKVMEVDKENGLVYVYFSTPRKAGGGTVIVTLGEGNEAEKGEHYVYMYPEIQSVTFYGETAGDEIANRPYLGERPGLGLDRQYWALGCEKTIGLNQEDEIRVAVNVAGGETEDILEAIKCFRWVPTWSLSDTENFKIISESYELVEGQGFDIILKVASTDKTGEYEIWYSTPWLNELGSNEILYLRYTVSDLSRVQEITVDQEDVEVSYREYAIVRVDMVPQLSWLYQHPQITIADPDIVEARIDYTGSYPYCLVIEGKGVGTTTVTLSAYNGDELVTKDIKVTVNDPVSRVVIDNNSGDTYIFADGTTTWKADAYSTSNALMNDVPLTWSSSNSSVATVDNNGVITGVAAGTAAITAASGNVVSGASYVRVVNVPDAITSPYDFQGFFEDATDIWFLDQNEGILVIPDGYADGVFEGTYNLDGAYYMNSGAKAPATGTVTISKGAGEYEYIVTMDVSINLSGTKSVSFKFSNGIVEFLPE